MYESRGLSVAHLVLIGEESERVDEWGLEEQRELIQAHLVTIGEVKDGVEE